jgi:hypothetical protein
MPKEPMPDVVVLVPGIMGSVLAKDGREMWGPSRGALLRGFLSRGRNLDELALRGDSPDAGDLGDGVVPLRVMPSPHLLPGLWKIDGYGELRAALEATFDLEPGVNYVEFAYDWRRDNRAAAKRLHRDARAWLDRRRDDDGVADPKLILVAHSMGGLVCRYFTEVLEGWRMTRALFTFGTPFRGSLNALDNLSNGVRKGPRGIVNLSDLVRSFTSVYQLLPTYPCYSADGGDYMRVGESRGIPHVAPERAADALAFHREIEQGVERNLEDESYRRGYRIQPVVGFRQPTSQSARLAGDGLAVAGTHGGEDHGGDGTVPRVSATPLELSDAGRDVLVSTRHAALQAAGSVLDFLDGAIRDLYLNLGDFRRPEVSGARVSMRLEDAYDSAESVIVGVRADREAAVGLRVERETDRAPVAEVRLSASTDQWRNHGVGSLPEGVYRVVAKPDDGEAARDVFVVYSEAEAARDAEG